MDVRHYLDLEAGVSEDEEMSMGSDGEPNRFIDDNGDDDGDSNEDDRNDEEFLTGLTTHEDGVEELQEIAKQIRNRYAVSGSDNGREYDEMNIPLWEIGVPRGLEHAYARRLRRSPIIVPDRSNWRVRSKRSRRSKRGEYDERPGHFHSVFVIPQLFGRIFIQSTDRTEVLRRMENLKNNFHKQPFLVPQSEVPQLLQMRQSEEKLQPPISPGQWVRLKSGLYHNDIGMVKTETRNEYGDVVQYDVLVVPRLYFETNMNTGIVEPAKFTKKNRLPARLIRLINARKRVGEGNVQGTEEEFTLFGERIWHSLHLITKSKSECNLVLCPSAYELVHFTSARINTLEATNRAFLSLRDCIRVVKGPMQGRIGVVNSLGGQAVSALLEPQDQAFPDSSCTDLQWDDVERIFEIGDLVEIVLGSHAGKTGMIVSVSLDSLAIGCRNTTELSQSLDGPLFVIDSVRPAFIRTSTSGFVSMAMKEPVPFTNAVRRGSLPSEDQTSVLGPELTAKDMCSTDVEKSTSGSSGTDPSSPKAPEDNKSSSKNGPVPASDWVTGSPVVVRYGQVKGVADLHSWDGKEGIVFFPDGRGFMKVEAQYVISGDALLHSKEPCTFAGRRIAGIEHKILKAKVEKYLEERPRAPLNAAINLPGLDERIGSPVWIFKGERKGVAELQAIGKNHAFVHFPGRIQALSQISLDSAVSSVDWKQLDEQEIDEEMENCARVAIGEFIGVALPAARARVIQSEGQVKEQIPTSAASESLDSSPALSEEPDVNHMMWLLDPDFQPILRDYSVFLRISKSHRSSSYKGVAVRTLEDSFPSVSPVTVAGRVESRASICVKFKTTHGLDKTESVELCDLILHEPKLKAAALVVAGAHRGEKLFVQRLDKEDKTKCWCRPLQSTCRVKHFCISVSDVTKIEPFSL